MSIKINTQSESRSLSFLKWMQSTVKSQYYSHTESIDNAIEIVQKGKQPTNSALIPRIKNEIY